MSKLPSILKVFLFFFLSLGVMGTLISCKKKEAATKAVASGQTDVSSSGATASTKALNFDGTVLARLPKGALGVYYVDVEHPAWKKYQKSPWSEGSKFNDFLKIVSEDQDKTLKLLEKLELNDQNSLGDVFSETAVYMAPLASGAPMDGSNTVNVGAVWKSKDADKLASRMKTIKAELEAEGFKTAALGEESVEGFRLTELKNDKGQPIPDVFLGAKENWAGIANSESGLRGLLASEQSVPDVLKSETFTRIFSQLPGEDERYAFGYFEVGKMLPLLEDLSKQAGEKNAFSAESIPVEAAAFSASMTDTPQIDFRLAFKEGADATESKLLANSSSANILRILPDNPMFSLSIDGATARGVRDSLLQQGKGKLDQQLVDSLAVLDGVQRIALSARVAPVGQSLLPIPDLLVAFETNDVEGGKAKIKNLIGSAMAGTGVQGSSWMKKKLGTQEAEVMMSPFGMGAYVTSVGNTLLLSSSDPQIRASVANIENEKSAFSTQLASKSRDALYAKDSVGNLMVDFAEVGSLLENMGGLLSMYAPQQAGAANEMLSPDKIKQLKSKGRMISTVRSEKGMLGITSFFEAGKVKKPA